LRIYPNSKRLYRTCDVLNLPFADIVKSDVKGTVYLLSN